MGVLWRKRSFLLKLIVVVGTAWFTIAFLLYNDDRTANRIALPVPDSNQVPETPPKGLPLKKEQSLPRKEDERPVLLPPIANAGEMGKPVVLPSNLTGKFCRKSFHKIFKHL